MKLVNRETIPEFDTEQVQDSTTFLLRSASPLNKRHKRLVDEGYYEAHCIDLRIAWNKYRNRHDAEIDFELLGVAPGGVVTKHQAMGSNRSKPELTPRSHLGKFIREKLAVGYGMHASMRDVFVVPGRVYRVYVKTIKHPKGEEIDRPETEWYSVVKAVLDIVDVAAESALAPGDYPF